MIASVYNRELQNGGALCDPNVLDIARMNIDLSTFVALLELAGLSEYFMCAGPFTLLAPTNEAFQALDPATFQQLLLPANRQRLQDLLLYHILPGLYLSADFNDGSTLDTLLPGESVSVTINPIVFNGRAAVVQSDIIACNGVIDIIDDVLVPGTCLISARPTA